MAGKVVEFRCGLEGVIPKQSPDLLKDGQYRALSNIVSNQEGSVSSRTGVKQVGQLTAAEPTCYFVRKLVVQAGEDPITPSTNPRYLGVLTSGGQRNIYRTTDYTFKSLVASGVDSVASRHWEMADYTAGSAGTPWAYFACPNAMLKDSGVSPYPTLPKWGIPPAAGVALAATVKGPVIITAITWGAPNWDGIAITLASEVGLSDHDSLTISGVTGVSIVTTDGVSDINTSWEIRAGTPDSNGDINKTTTVFRIFDTNGQMVAGAGTYPGGGSVTNVTLAGNLDGGAENSSNETQPYDWTLVYEETDTGDTGNPSQPMAAGSSATTTISGVTYTAQPLSIRLGSAGVVVWGVADSRIGFIRLYRRGGLLFDTWRLVARVPNPGAEAATVVVDNIADADLEFAEQIETDNDPPVASTVASPIHSTVSVAVSAGWRTANISTSAFGAVTPGTLVHVIDPLGSEDVYVESASANSFRAYFQFGHAAGIPVEVNAITGQNCNIVVAIGESLLVAGDPNNPHIVYKSKNGRPQAFPVGTDAAGAITSISAGTPANGILAMTECRGQALTLNVSSLFEVAVIQGSLQQPARVSEKGLRAQSAWCKTDAGEVWYLSDDGVYSWNGGSHQKRTEAVDPIFHSQQFNGMTPLDWSPAALASARMEFRRGVVHLLYVDIAGHAREIVCEPMYGDRWIPGRQDYYETSLPEYPTTMLYREPDTQSLIVCVNNSLLGATFGVADVTVVINGVNFTTDWWASTVATGNLIPWSITLPWFDMGQPATRKLFEEVWLDADPQLYATGVYAWPSSVSIDLLLDYSEAAVETFNINIPTGDRLIGRQMLSLLPNLQNTSGSIYQSYGREARAISFRISGLAHPVQFTLYRILMQYEEVGMLSAGSATDWMDLGAKTDKRLYQMAVVFDSAGTDRQIVLESRGGRDGKTVGTSQVFTLSSPTDLGSGRCLKTFPLAEPTIGKLFRVRPYSSATISGGNPVASVDLFRIMEVTFPEPEPYPADIVSLTPWEDGGYGYLKYANQLVLEVNTNNVAVTFKVQADGADKATLTVTSTENDRQRTITLPANLTGYRWRITCDPAQSAIASGAGMWQLFNHSFKFQQADLGEVTHTMDWSDLGHRFDKKLYALTLRWDNSGGAAVTMVLDLLSGVSGGTVRAAVATFLLPAGSGRSEKTFPLPDGLIAKAVRVYPQGNTLPAGFKSWQYDFQKEDYPADIVAFTPLENGGYEYDKYANQIDFEVNTNNVAVTVQVQADGATVATFPITSTEPNRRRNITLPTGLRGKNWRIFVDPSQAAFTSGVGMWQLFSHSFKFQQADLGEVVHTTDWNNLGSPYDKRLYTLTLRWDNTSGADVTMALDLLSGINGGTVQTAVKTFLLPAGSGRSEKTFALPDGLIAKDVRVYPQGSTIPVGFKSWPYEFEKEVYPPDIVAFTPYENGGYEYDKYANQIDFEVNTNGVPVTVQLQVDGATVAAFPITSTESDRRRNVTLDTGLRGKNWRIFVDPNQTAFTSNVGMWQLFSHRFVFQQADKGEVGHSFDWDDLGHPYDKQLLNITIEYDTTIGGAITLQMDTLSGIGGTTTTANVARFTLGTGRGKTTYPLPADTVAKMVRVYPAAAVPTGYKQWKYQFDKIDYPADTVRVTAWKDASAPVDKEPSWLSIDADTSGTVASVQLQNEIGTVITVSHVGVSSNRKKNYAIPADTRAKMWRLVSAEAFGGRFQLFNWGFERWQPFDLASPIDPPEIILATPWTDMGYPFGKMARDLVLTINTGGIPCAVALQTNEAGTVATFPVTTTNTTRRVVLSCPANLQGTLWRLLLTPGTAGLSQLWNWALDAVKMPPSLTRWSSNQQGFGYKGFHFQKQAWLDYVCAGTISVVFTSDTGALTITLPAHPVRGAERYLLPAVWGVGLNKTKLISVDIVANDVTKPFQFWADLSGIEWLPCGADRHTAYQQTPLSSFMDVQV